MQHGAYPRAIKDGQKLRVSYYHAVTIYDNQVPCSLTESKVFEIVEDQVRRVQKLFEPQTYFLSHDEIRVANWSERRARPPVSNSPTTSAAVPRSCAASTRRHGCASGATCSIRTTTP